MVTIPIYKQSDYAKLYQFDEELDYISSKLNALGLQDLYLWFRQFLTKKVPEYFWSVPASSTGKHHNETENGIGGLIRHTRSVFKVAQSLYETGMYEFGEPEKTLILMAIILHDSFKFSNETNKKVNEALESINDGDFVNIDVGYTVQNHPLVAAMKIIEDGKEYNGEHSHFINEIAKLVATHSGKWTTNQKGEEVLQKPETEAQKFVHLCDYIASRNFITVKID